MKEYQRFASTFADSGLSRPLEGQSDDCCVLSWWMRWQSKISKRVFEETYPSGSTFSSQVATCKPFVLDLPGACSLAHACPAAAAVAVAAEAAVAAAAVAVAVQTVLVVVVASGFAAVVVVLVVAAAVVAVVVVVVVPSLVACFRAGSTLLDDSHLSCESC